MKWRGRWIKLRNGQWGACIKLNKSGPRPQLSDLVVVSSKDGRITTRKLRYFESSDATEARVALFSAPPMSRPPPRCVPPPGEDLKPTTSDWRSTTRNRRAAWTRRHFTRR